MEKYLRIIAFAIGSMLVGIIISFTVQQKINVLKNDTSGDVPVITVKEREKQLKCLTQNIYHEARGEPFEGKVAIAQVTINRSQSGKFPKDICAVVFQKNIIMEKIVCQFSWYCENPGKPKVENREQYNECYEVAKKVLLEDFRLNSLKDAMYFHAVYVNPNWNKEKIGKIGNHIFYK